MLRAAPAVSLVALLSLSTLGLPGCSQEPESIEAIGEARGAARLADLDVTLPRGDATGAIGLRAPQAEFLGDGPSGIALGPDGSVLVADRLHGRAVRVDAAGAHHAFALDADVEALAVGDDGAIALFSPLRSRVDLRTAEGAPLGEVAVPRTVGDVVGLSLGASRRVEIQTAYQERFVAGSANAPLDANAVLRTKREGAVSLDPDRALEALLDASGTAFVVVVATRDGERAHEERRLEVARGAASVRVLGVDRGRVVALVERLKQDGIGAISVTRELVVASLESGTVLATEPMISGGAWVPRQFVSVGGGAVAYMVPLPDGLRVVRRSVDAIVLAGGAK